MKIGQPDLTKSDDKSTLAGKLNSLVYSFQDTAKTLNETDGFLKYFGRNSCEII